MSLESTHGPAEWSLLKSHAQRNALICVDGQLDLLVAARAIAEDDTAQVALWLSQGLLKRPTPSQMAQWDLAPSKTFESVIVAPYVLIRELRS